MASIPNLTSRSRLFHVVALVEALDWPLFQGKGCPMAGEGEAVDLVPEVDLGFLTLEAESGLERREEDMLSAPVTSCSSYYVNNLCTLDLAVWTKYLFVILFYKRNLT